MTLEQMIADAEAKYHKLTTGQMARVIVDQNGERVEFIGANADRLLAYINTLKAQLTRAATGPMRVWI